MHITFTHLRYRAIVSVHHYCGYVSQSKNLQTLTFNSAKSKLHHLSDPDQIIDIFNSALERAGVVRARYLQDLAIRQLAKAQCFTEIETLLENQKKNPKIKSEKFLHGLFISYGRAKMVDQAIKLFYQMDELGIPRSVDSFNALLTACKDAGDFKKVTELFAEIPVKFSLHPNKVSYSILIKSICEMGSPKLAYQKLEEMKERQAEVTTIIYTTLIDSLYKSNNSEEAEKVWDEMVKAGCSPDTAAYNSRVSYIAHHGLPEEALEVIAEMKASGVKPSVITYNLLLICYCKNGNFEGPKRAFEEMGKKGFPPNDFSFRVFLHFLCKKEDYDSALEVFKDCVTKKKAPDFEALGLLVKGLMRNSKDEEAREIIKLVMDSYPEDWSANAKEFEAGLGKRQKEALMTEWLSKQ
ncbi:hypothetical protein AMTRI_Chr04g252580 [Amborella trichopoda]